MSNFEQKANARVEEAAVLKGLSLASIQEAGKSMPLREGCSDFFKRLESGEVLVDTCILSVCWSKTFIEAVLEKGKSSDTTLVLQIWITRIRTFIIISPNVFYCCLRMSSF